LIQYDESVSILQAEYTGPDSLVCIPNASNFSSIDYINDGSVIVMWTGPDLMYNLNMEVNHLNGK